MLYSILHTTARPDSWRASYDAWIENAVYSEAVEYVLCVDRRWGFEGATKESLGLRECDKLVWNNGRKCMVDGYAFAAAASTGQTLFLNSDDMRPCEGWDIRIEDALDSVGDYVVQVSSGTPADDRDLMVLQILSRARFERLGYVLYPEYESMYADDDFSEHARHDGVVIDAKHLVFPHLHGKIEDDTVYQHQNSQGAYSKGYSILQKRRQNGFTRITEEQKRPKTISFLLPGEHFSVHYLRAAFELWAGAISSGFGCHNFTGHCSDVRITRTMLHSQMVLAGKESPIDYVVWIDDDNAVTWDQVQTLLADLEVLPERSVVVGWTLIQHDLIADFESSPPRASVATMEGKKWESVPLPDLRNATGLLPIDLSGFPVVAMKYETAAMMGKFPFQPIVNDEFEWGQTGEDVSFCLKLKDLGGQLFVDPRIEVPHLKLRPVMEIRTADVRPKEEVQEMSAVETL